MHALSVNPDGSERLEYTMAGMPVRASTDRLGIFQDYAAACHWHDDFELLAAVDGEMDCFVNGRTVHLKKGDAVFVNARRLHCGYSEQRRDCAYRFVLFHPSVLGELPPVREALAAFAADDAPDCWALDAASEAMLIFGELYEAAATGNAVRAVGECARLVDTLARQGSAEREGQGDQRWRLLRRMTGYIQARYADRITLDGIAAAGAVCRNRCCVLFREGLGCSPMEYVTRYRLDKACALLREGASVTEAALSSGFHGASYFAEVFRRTWGITPREYQRQREQRTGCAELRIENGGANPPGLP